MSAWRRFRNLWRQDSLDREFNDELSLHIQLRAEANMRAGMSREDAERQARQHLGSLNQVREGMREARVVCWIDTLARDLRHGARLLLRQPVLASLAVLTLALGIGANAAIFSLLSAAMLRPLPFPDSNLLITIVEGFRVDGSSGIPPTVPELLDVRKSSRTIDRLSFYDTRDYQINGGSEPERVFAARIEASFLNLLGVRPAYGRLFNADENLPGRENVVILSDSLWRRNFAGDPAAVGQNIIVNGASSKIVGVLPPAFSFDYQSSERIEMYVPFLMSETYTSRNAPFVNVRHVSAIARLKPGVPVESASAELQAISQDLAVHYPEVYRRGSDALDTGFFMTVLSLHESLTGSRQNVLVLLFAAVALVLVIACVNTAQFLISRSVERQAEVAVRSALGASRSRLASQFLTEAMILGAAGGALGLLLLFWLNKGILAILPTRVAIGLIGQVRVDGTALAFIVAATLLTMIACGLAPALSFGRLDPAPSMAGRGFVPGRARGRHMLIALEVSLSALLLVVAGLLWQSLREMQNAPSGYSADNVMTMQIRLGPDAIAGRARFVEAVSAIPGVEAAALADGALPFGTNTDFAIEGEPADAATLARQLASYRMVSPAYFSLLRIPFREGRTFTTGDTRDRPPVAIVSEDLARRSWPGQTAIGRRLRAGSGPRNAVLTVVGVVGNVRTALQTTTIPQIYVPNLQQEEPNATLLVRTLGNVSVSPEAIKKAIRSVVPSQPVFNIRPVSEILAQSLADQRTITVLLGSFAFLALFMSVTGVFTVVTYLTSRRTKEIAIRLAVGANSRNVLRLVAGQTLVWTVVGLAFGLAGSIAASTALRAAVRGVVRLDPLTMCLVGGLYLLLVTSAICVPALNALRVDPGSILRVD